MVPLTSAGLAGVEPADAGAASGLVNVTQQVGAALGLAVLVTVLGVAAGHAQLRAGGAATATVIHGLDLTLAVGALFGLAALAMVALLVHLPSAATNRVSVPGEREREHAALALAVGEDFEWADPEMVA
jgi:hypothetical protein